jgi:NADPH2:quinone reductase
MKAVRVEARGEAPTVRTDLPEPTPAADEVLVRVQASSANPVDIGIAAGMLEGMIEHKYPITLGRDYAGVVEQVGADVTRYAPGDEVYGFVRHADPAVHAGSWAELITVPEDVSIARKPGSIDPAIAGAASLTGITAMALVDALELSERDTVLVVGATGGVGSLAVQLAVRAGATVIASGLPEDEKYLLTLGVGEWIERDTDLGDDVRVNAVLDVVSYEPGAFDAALEPDGRVASPTGAAGEGPGRTNVMALPSTEDLERLAQLLLTGALTVHVQDRYDLDHAAEALQVLGSTHTRGKLGIDVA